MQVVSMMSMQGDADELASKMEKLRAVAERVAPKYGAISNTLLRTDDGIMIVNHWADEDGRHKMAEDPEIRAAMGEIGITPSFTAYEVMEHRTAAQ
jgi:hypothetical protein